MRDLFESSEPVLVLGVSELIERLRDVLDEEFAALWVEGEIASLHRSRGGHTYFDLKDADGQLRCVMFRSVSRGLPFPLEEGLLVQVRARMDVYPLRGTLQLIVEELKPAGEGALRLAFEELKRRLFEEGLFAPEGKQPLPALPRRIGLITSVQGAAIHDFLRALRRRSAQADVLVYDARVQGETAWREVVRGLHLLDAEPGVSVIVLARGGGSLEDLWTFNREELVRAIHRARTPVVSAIGHEIDLVLTDLVADARAATPSAAAELVVPDAEQLVARLAELRRRLVQHQRSILVERGGRLLLARRGLVHPAERLQAVQRRVQDAQRRLSSATSRALALRRSALGRAKAALGGRVRAFVERRVAHLRTAAARLDALSPLAVLERGYALARLVPGGAILRSSRDAPPGSEIDVKLARGSLRASVRTQTEDG